MNKKTWRSVRRRSAGSAFILKHFFAGLKGMGIIDSALETLFHSRRSQSAMERQLERTLKREVELTRQLAKLRLENSESAPELGIRLDLLQFDLAREKSEVARLAAELQKAQDDLKLEKANRSAAVHLLKKHGVIDGVAYASFTREQRVELIAQAMDEVAGTDLTSRWRERSPANAQPRSRH